MALSTFFVASGVLILAVISNSSDDDEVVDEICGIDEWNLETHVYEQAPPSPRFQPSDTAECRKGLDERYEMASRTYESGRAS